MTELKKHAVGVVSACIMSLTAMLGAGLFTLLFTLSVLDSYSSKGTESVGAPYLQVFAAAVALIFSTLCIAGAAAAAKLFLRYLQELHDPGSTYERTPKEWLELLIRPESRQTHVLMFSDIYRDEQKILRDAFIVGMLADGMNLRDLREPDRFRHLQASQPTATSA